MSKWRFALSLLVRRLWLHAGVFSLAAVAAVLAAAAIQPFIHLGEPYQLGSRAVEALLAVIASSMLAVATFSLGTLVNAFGMVQTTATPRAAALLIEDRSAQTALSGFIGAFIFSIVAMVALSTGIYGPDGRAILFLETMLVLLLTAGAFLHWVDEASRMGQMSETIARVENNTVRALRQMLKRPHLGASPAVSPPPGCLNLTAKRVGYLQHIDVGVLEAKARRLGLCIHLQIAPGEFVDGSRPLALIECGGEDLPDDYRERLISAFVIGDVRTFNQDPAYGLVMLREIACRALSPAINDAGTAIAVIGTAVRVLRVWTEPCEEETVEHRRVRAPTLDPAALFDDVFTPIARDGAALLEVGVPLQAAFLALAAMPGNGFEDAAKAQAMMAVERARKAMNHAADVARLERAAQPLLGEDAQRRKSAAQERELAEVLP